ncbi:DUF2934 domain-containing protein [Nitrobacter vulgaris]|uniref:DUF2934 domain-containing protein n=1 Tax=Nitrobacter vulgaris TaxID=29421 RepID=A0A1V4HYD7_NITVU|nr:DUF2934 domain-containing protein [Nitrobacter vulgaris]OPH82879.1 hypothetical protein B2M20_10140 [Nitrobacter vulgaris]
MQNEIEEVVKDTAAVGLSAAVLELEMGTELARRALAELSRADPTASPSTTPPSAYAAPSATRASSAPALAEKVINVWEQAGCPEGRDKEFYFQAEQELRDEAMRALPADAMIKRRHGDNSRYSP